jgi:natural product precursor
MTKVKFNDLTGNAMVLKVEELAVITGGDGGCGDGCSTSVCVNKWRKYTW